MNIRRWVTCLKALDPKTERMKTWAGPPVPGITFDEAQQWCEDHGFGYLTVIGELVTEIEEDGEETDYESIHSN